MKVLKGLRRENANDLNLILLRKTKSKNKVIQALRDVDEKRGVEVVLFRNNCHPVYVP